jgi:hypothetical protein
MSRFYHRLVNVAFCCIRFLIDRLTLPPNQRFYLLRLVPSERGVAHRHERWVRDAMDALAAQDERRLRRTAKSCGPDAPTLASSFAGSFPAQATVAKKPGHRGEHEVTVKTVAQGRPGETGEPVVTTLVCFHFVAREAAGASSTRLSLRPLFFRGWFAQPLGRDPRRENAETCLFLPRPVLAGRGLG